MLPTVKKSVRTILLFLCVVKAWSSCVGQSISPVYNNMPGGSFRITAPCDTVSEPGPNIMTVFQDSKNVYWFASWEDGLYRYDPAVTDARGDRYLLHFTIKSGLPHHRIEDLREDRSGTLFFNTPEGVCRFDGHQFSKVPVAESSTWRLQPGDLWFKSLHFNGPVYRYDGAMLHRLHLPTCPDVEAWKAQQPTYHDPYGIYTVYKDRHGDVWFGTAAAGVCRYDGHSFDWISGPDVNELHNGRSNGVRSIIEDADGRFWFCNTIYRYTIDGKFRPAGHQDTLAYSREPGIGSLDGITGSDFLEYLSAVVDSNGHVWIATYGGGAYQYDGKKIIHHAVQDAGKDITLFSVYKDNHGGLWLGTHENGVFRYNGRSFERFRP